MLLPFFLLFFSLPVRIRVVTVLSLVLRYSIVESLKEKQERNKKRKYEKK